MMFSLVISSDRDIKKKKKSAINTDYGFGSIYNHKCINKS